MDAGWLVVPAVAVVLVFVIGSWLALRGDRAVADRVASVGFYGCLFVVAVILLGLVMFR